jgi:glycerophosphoryl diester phosphodiesterase
MSWPGPGPWPPAATAVIAHRGGRQPGVRENSLPALQGAIAAGADFIEFDVRRTADGALVINHDPRLDGVAIARAPLERLRALPHPPALLEEVVARLGGRIGLDVELKEAGYEAEVLALLGPALNGAPPVFLSSFLVEAVAAVRRLAPGVPAGLLVGDGRGLARRLQASEATLVLPWWRLDRSPFRARVARHGLAEAAWTVDDPRAIAARLRDPRVAGVITNLPRRAVELREREARS